MQTSATTVRHRLLLGGGAALVGRTGVAFGVVLVNALVARLLGPAETGIFLLALSLVTVATVVADFGFGKTLLKVVPEAMLRGERARAIAHVRRVYSAALITVLLTSALLLSPLGDWLATGLAQGAGLVELMPLVALWLVATLALNLLAETYRGLHRIGAAVFFGGALTGLGNILLVTLVLGLVWLGPVTITLERVLWIFIVAGFTLAVVAAWRLAIHLPEYARGMRESLRGLFAMAWPFWVANTALVVLIHAEIWILGYLRPAEEVAVFGLVARLALLVSFPLVIINSVIPPLITELHALDDLGRLERMLRAAAGLTTLGAGLLFLVLLLFGEPISGLLFGDYFRDSGDILAILAFGQLFHVWAGSGGFVLHMTGHQDTMMKITLATGLATVLLGVGLTSLYGVLGMAVASATGLVLQNLLMLWFIRRLLGIRIHAGMAGVMDIYTEVLRRVRP